MSASFAYCPHCAAPGGAWREGREYRCPSCGFRFFQNVATAVGCLIEHQGRVLFLRRAQEPSRGLLGLPGGFVDPGESVEQALRREAHEEIGASLASLKFLTSFPNQYPFAGVTYHTCDLYFRAKLKGRPEDLRADPDEVQNLVWLEASAVKSEQLAFPSLRALWSFLLLPSGSE